MDFWPPNSPFQSEWQGKNKKTTKVTQFNYPIVAQGAIGAANLVYNDSHLQWTFLTQASRGRKVVTQGKSTKIFPASRVSSLSTSRLSTRHRAEQGAQFLRTHYPDVDISSDLIREELTAEARFSTDLQIFDPLAGNLLTSFSINARTRNKSLYLAFPMGETGSELNISPFHYSKDFATFKPFANAIRKFDTPIRQVVAYDGSLLSQNDDTYVAVRTFGATHLIGVRTGSQGLFATELADILRSDTRDRPIVDMSFSRDTRTLLLVNDVGDVYSAGADNERRITHRCVSSSSENDRFWRIATASQERTALLLSSSSIDMLDFRIENHGATLLSDLPSSERFTFVEGESVDHMIRLASTTHLFWVDERYPRRPILAIDHGRRWDCSLRVQTMVFDKHPMTFLSSEKHGLTTIYDVSTGSDGFVHLNAPPYPLRLSDPAMRRIGRALIRHPLQSDRAHAMILELSSRGGIHRTDVRLSDSEAGESQPNVREHSHDWSVEVPGLDVQMEGENAAVDMGSLSKRGFSEVDLEPAYRLIFDMEDSRIDIGPDAVFNTLDSMPTLWQDLDAPVEHFLTTFDVAFQAGNEPGAISRADFFTESALNSKRGFRALVQNRIPVKHVSERAAWHHRLYPTLSHFVPQLQDSPTAVLQALGRYSLTVDDYRPGPSIRREIESQEQLTLDLALCQDVFSPFRICLSGPEEALDEAFETMSLAADAMLFDVPEPNSVQFGLLRPLRTRGIDHYAKGRTDNIDGPCPLGVRLLLQEWEIGSDPQTYTYHDPYDSTASPAIITRARRQIHGKSPNQIPSTSMRSRRPPTIAAAPPVIPPSKAQKIPDVLIGENLSTSIRNIDRPVASSQPVQWDTLPQASQGTPFPSTQVLSGPFGGRQTTAKKKQVKKRIGGF